MIKAISLLETIIVMGIIAVLMAIGTAGLIQFKSTIELQNALSDVSSTLKNLQNSARNSVANNTSTLKIPDYFAITFSQNNYKIKNCTKVSTRLTCTDDPNSTGLNTVQMSLVNFSVPSNCTTIGFERLSGKILSINDNGDYSSAGTCNIRIIHTNTSNSKEIKIDLESSNIEI